MGSSEVCGLAIAEKAEEVFLYYRFLDKKYHCRPFFVDSKQVPGHANALCPPKMKTAMDRVGGEGGGVYFMKYFYVSKTKFN
jgi:hypothetical protein